MSDDEQLRDVRQRIDALDEQIQRLISQRASIRVVGLPCPGGCELS